MLLESVFNYSELKDFENVMRNFILRLFFYRICKNEKINEIYLDFIFNVSF